MRNINWRIVLLLVVVVLICVNQVSAVESAGQHPGAEDPYALTISGGISLGVYEAGLNWIIVDTLRDKFLDAGQTKYRLDTVTGASAGAINTLISAIRFSELDSTKSIYNNLYKKTWQDVDVEKLLESPTDDDLLRLDLGVEKKKALPDSIFTRKVFKGIIDDLRLSVEKGQFRKNSEVKLAFTVTRSVPLKTTIQTATGSEEVETQRTVIPLIAMAEKKEDGFGLVFKNNTSYQPVNGKNMELIYLPQVKGRVEFDAVARAVLASSAFPMAFSRVELQHCQQTTGDTAADTDLAGTCPEGYAVENGYFSDGGAFDNVPLGLTVELVEQTETGYQHVPATYIYMDPAKRRGVKSNPVDPGSIENSLELPLNDDIDFSFLVLEEQLKALIPTLGTMSTGELRRSLIGMFDIKNGDNGHRHLRQTSRFPALTGNFIGHFGAFFDDSFRLYDYSAGVYDGLMNVTNYLCAQDEECNPNDPAFEVKQAEIFIDLVNKQLDFNTAPYQNQKINQLVGAFLAKEKTTPAWDEAKAKFPVLDKEAAADTVYAVMSQIDESDKKAFKKFLAMLKPDKDKFSPRVQKMIESPKYWALDLGQRVIERLIEIEKKGGGKHQLLLKVASVVANLKEARKNHATWSLSSVKKEKGWLGFYFPKKKWYMLVPDSIAMDGAQSAVSVSYLAAPKKIIGEWGYFEWEPFSFHQQFKEVNGTRLNYWRTGGSFRHPFENVALSSIGIGLYANQNLSGTNRFGNDFMFGGEVNLGLVADKLRISIGTRDMTGTYDGEMLTVSMGFTDIDSWLSMAF